MYPMQIPVLEKKISHMIFSNYENSYRFIIHMIPARQYHDISLGVTLKLIYLLVFLLFIKYIHLLFGNSIVCEHCGYILFSLYYYLSSKLQKDRRNRVWFDC